MDKIEKNKLVRKASESIAQVTPEVKTEVGMDVSVPVVFSSISIMEVEAVPVVVEIVKQSERPKKPKSPVERDNEAIPTTDGLETTTGN